MVSSNRHNPEVGATILILTEKETERQSKLFRPLKQKRMESHPNAGLPDSEEGREEEVAWKTGREGGRAKD